VSAPEFRNRSDAGKVLARALESHRSQHPLILGLPRGGVPVAWEIARALDTDLDVLVVRKLGVPWQPEFAFGAIGEGGVTIVDYEVCAETGIDDKDVQAVLQHERIELLRRVDMFRGSQPLMDVRDRDVIVVDDGIATGSTMLAAISVLRNLGAHRITVAVPVASQSAMNRIAPHVDEFMCLHTPEPFYAVGVHYENFGQESDEHVRNLLAGFGTLPVSIPSTGLLGQEIYLPGSLTLPSNLKGIVIFAHGSGSSRLSARNIHVARILNRAGIGTLLFDLLTDREALDRQNIFDIDLLASRLESAVDYIRSNEQWSKWPIGLFGASTGAAAALVTASRRREQVSAVVSRGGRPDLAGASLSLVDAPTLFIVGGEDHEVIELNKFASQHLHCPNELKIVSGATHLFEEPGTLDQAAVLAKDWFVSHLPLHLVY
jgi:putative phosphoribosyl transferase